MKLGQVSGLHIAFLMLTVMLLSVPASRFLLAGHVRSEDVDVLALRIFPFAIFGLLVVSMRPLRLRARQLLHAPVRAIHYREVLLAALAMVPLAWATTGARVLWIGLFGDADALSSMKVNADAEWRNALTTRGVAFLAATVVVAPLLEELLCRGFLYRAFARDWGWFRGAIATSVVFAAYHPFFLNAFVGSIVFVCVMRRTGSLWAAIVVHAFSNLMAWWPLMGQYVFPDPSLSPVEPSTWIRNLVALAAAVVVLPTYIWMSRDRDEIAATVMMEPNGALPK